MINSLTHDKLKFEEKELVNFLANPLDYVHCLDYGYIPTIKSIKELYGSYFCYKVGMTLNEYYYNGLANDRYNFWYKVLRDNNSIVR